jgi:hypothetical protein
METVPVTSPSNIDAPGPDGLARAIVAEAIEFECTRRDLKPIEILDLVMRGRKGTAPNFGSIDGLVGQHLVDPASPFGALLAAAFDEQVTLSGLRKVSADTSPPSSFERFWLERVMRAFRERYRLHVPLGRE